MRFCEKENDRKKLFTLEVSTGDVNGFEDRTETEFFLDLERLLIFVVDTLAEMCASLAIVVLMPPLMLTELIGFPFTYSALLMPMDGRAVPC